MYNDNKMYIPLVKYIMIIFTNNLYFYLNYFDDKLQPDFTLNNLL